MSIERIDVGARMSQAVIYNGVVYTAGQVANSATGAESVGEQTREILQQIDDLLKRAGTDKSKLLKATIWITDMDRFAEMNEVWDAWVAPGNAPVRACVESKLALPKFDVEIMVEASV
jgi:enamine deaminase RidA (YjgF/YER057c/UK114 family)